MSAKREAEALRSVDASVAPAGSEAGCRALASLAPGERICLCAHIDAEAVGRLGDLGLVPGTVVTLLRRAPLGDPLEVELRGFRLCVRSADVAGICGRAVAADVRAVAS
jgi:ferrous iron transport protein A